MNKEQQTLQLILEQLHETNSLLNQLVKTNQAILKESRKQHSKSKSLIVESNITKKELLDPSRLINTILKQSLDDTITKKGK